MGWIWSPDHSIPLWRCAGFLFKASASFKHSKAAHKTTHCPECAKSANQRRKTYLRAWEMRDRRFSTCWQSPAPSFILKVVCRETPWLHASMLVRFCVCFKSCWKSSDLHSRSLELAKHQCWPVQEKADQHAFPPIS